MQFVRFVGVQVRQPEDAAQGRHDEVFESKTEVFTHDVQMVGFVGSQELQPGGHATQSVENVIWLYIIAKPEEQARQNPT